MYCARCLLPVVNRKAFSADTVYMHSVTCTRVNYSYSVLLHYSAQYEQSIRPIIRHRSEYNRYSTNYFELHGQCDVVGGLMILGLESRAGAGSTVSHSTFTRRNNTFGQVVHTSMSLRRLTNMGLTLRWPMGGDAPQSWGRSGSRLPLGPFSGK